MLKQTHMPKKARVYLSQVITENFLHIHLQ